jgi:hypothetical protein
MSRRTDSTQTEPLYPLVWQMHTTPDRYGQRCRIIDEGTMVEFADGVRLETHGWFLCSDLLFRLERGS